MVPVSVPAAPRSNPSSKHTVIAIGPLRLNCVCPIYLSFPQMGGILLALGLTIQGYRIFFSGLIRVCEHRAGGPWNKPTIDYGTV